MRRRREKGCFLSSQRESLGAEADDGMPEGVTKSTSKLLGVESRSGGLIQDLTEGVNEGVNDLGDHCMISLLLRQKGVRTGGDVRRSGSGTT